jgi:hypothetical protein
MIRPVTCLCLLAACGSGLYLYSEKHQTALLDREISRVIHAKEAANARSGLLRAEWALLNEPGRLEDMAGRYLTLHPMAPTQFVQGSDLPEHLPAAVAFSPASPADGEDDGDATGTAVASTATPTATAMQTADAVAPGLPSHHPMQPPIRPDAAHGTKLLAKADVPPAVAKHSPHHATMLAERQEPPAHEGLLPHGTPLPLAAPQPLGARVISAMARPMRAQPQPRIVAAVPSYAPPVASVLGGGGSLPPPVPYGR